MKNTIFALLKFNAIALAVLFIIGAIVTADANNRVNPIVPSLMFLGILYWNIKIILTRRREIVDSVKNKVIDVAAASIELKDAASARVQERIKERQNQK